jgi:pimeloyl-ACP methyl ester carboxylesterase
MSFLLLHGSAQNARGWDRLRSALEAGGHDVVCPELPKSAPTWGLGDYAASVAEHVGTHVSRPERLAAMLLGLAGNANRGSVRGTNEVTS